MYLNLQSGGIQKGSTWNKVQMAAHSMNRKAMRDTQSVKGKDGKDRRNDKVQITPENQMQGRLDFLCGMWFNKVRCFQDTRRILLQMKRKRRIWKSMASK